MTTPAQRSAMITYYNKNKALFYNNKLIYRLNKRIERWINEWTTYKF